MINVVLQIKLQILNMIVLRAEILTMIELQMVTICARNINICKQYKLCMSVFHIIYNISRLNFVILLILLFYSLYAFFHLIR